jgi:hypothetical protein
MNCPECNREVSDKPGTVSYSCTIPGCLAIRFCCPHCIVCHLVKHYDALQASHSRLVEAIKEGRRHYKNNCPINMFIVWEQALKEAKKIK